MQNLKLTLKPFKFEKEHCKIYKMILGIVN